MLRLMSGKTSDDYSVQLYLDSYMAKKLVNFHYDEFVRFILNYEKYMVDGKLYKDGLRYFILRKRDERLTIIQRIKRFYLLHRYGVVNTLIEEFGRKFIYDLRRVIKIIRLHINTNIIVRRSDWYDIVFSNWHRSPYAKWWSIPRNLSVLCYRLGISRYLCLKRGYKV